MAIYHLAVKVICRSKGQSAIAAAAYRSGEKLTDEATGQTKHYPARGERIRFTGIFAPPDAPSWVYDRNRLWNAAEQAETRKDATLAREIVVALPHELTDQQRIWLVSDYVREAFVRRGLVADVAIHAPDRNSDPRNFHAHILITERTIRGVGKPAEEIRAPESAGEFPPDRQGDAVPVDPGFAPKKDRSLYSKETLYGWRAQWSNLCNRHLARHNHAARINHRTLAEQRIDREPTRHLGLVDAQRMRRGVPTVRGDGLRAIRLRNALRTVTGAAREIAAFDKADSRHGGERVEIRAAASSIFKPPAKEHDLPRWLDTQGRSRSDGDRLCARQGASGGDVGMQPVREQRHDRPSPLKVFHHLEELANAETAVYRNRMHIAVATVALRCAAAQVTRRQTPEPEPCSYEAEAGAIVAKYATAIDAERRSNKPRHEIEAIIRALRHQQAVELAGIRERRKARAARRPKGMD